MFYQDYYPNDVSPNPLINISDLLNKLWSIFAFSNFEYNRNSFLLCK